MTPRMTPATFVLALSAVGALPVLAQTQTPATPSVAPSAASASPMLSSIILDFETRGYRVLDVEVNSDWIEVEAITPAGARIEAYVNPVTGQTVREENDN